jgi:predicted  nucleic acid-binding Zn-ribbon protein
MTSINSAGSSQVNHFAITEAKKAMLDNLAKEAADAQYEVEKYQAKVSALADDVERCREFLADAEGMRSKAKSNRDLLDQLIKQIADLQSQSEIANEAMVKDAYKTTDSFKTLNEVMQKLVYSGSLVNKLFTTVTRAKALNPLISDQLISSLNKAVADTNNAVALTLIALKSAYAAYTMNTESASAAALSHKISVSLQNSFTDKTANSTVRLINEAVNNAEAYYLKTQHMLVERTKQLTEASSQLNTAQVKLNGLQLGLAAGSAAAQPD